MYQPRPEDIVFVTAIVDMLKDGGIWGVPCTGMAYQIDKAKKTMTLIGRMDEVEGQMNMHEMNREVFREIGYTVIDATSNAEMN